MFPSLSSISVISSSFTFSLSSLGVSLPLAEEASVSSLMVTFFFSFISVPFSSDSFVFSCSTSVFSLASVSTCCSGVCRVMSLTTCSSLSPGLSADCTVTSRLPGWSTDCVVPSLSAGCSADCAVTSQRTVGSADSEALSSPADCSTMIMGASKTGSSISSLKLNLS